MKQRKPLERHTELRGGKPLARTGWLRRGGPIKAKRTAPSADEVQAKEIVRKRSRGWCEIRLAGICVGRALDWSHRIAKGRRGKWLPSNGLDGCRFCHDAITNTRGRRAEFEHWGYIVRTGVDTTLRPVLLGGERWVLLDDQGGMTDTDEPQRKQVA